VVDIFRRHQWIGFFEFLKGYDDDISFEFSITLNSQIEDSSTTMMRGLAISLSPKLISRVETLPLGIEWGREEKIASATTKKNFFTTNEKFVNEKNGVRKENL